MMTTPMKKIWTTLGATALVFAAGCNSDDDATGTLTVGITDAPVDSADQVVVEFTGVSVKPAEGQAEEFDFDSPRQINLLDLQGNLSEDLISDATVPAGQYNWIRLKVNAGRNGSDSFIVLDDGTTHPLFIPSGNRTGLKLVQGFTVPANASADFTIDFDLRKSVTNPEGFAEYILKPTLRLVDNTEVGSIAGTVDDAIASATDCSPAVYVFEGTDATVDDEGSDNAPVTSASVEMNDSGVFEYEVGFLTAGDYAAALTCDADSDNPETDDDITFEGQQNATVEADSTTTVDF